MSKKASENSEAFKIISKIDKKEYVLKTYFLK